MCAPCKQKLDKYPCKLVIDLLILFRDTAKNNYTAPNYKTREIHSLILNIILSI